MNGGVSILMASYNGSAFIVEQLKSIIRQLSAEDELIIVDDASTDTTAEIIKGISKNTNFEIKIINNDKNIGVARTFERLISESSKEIIFLSDQDDIWVEGRKMAMVRALHRSNCRAVLSNANIFNEQGFARKFFPEDRDPNVVSISRNFVRNNFVGCCMAFRRDVAVLAVPFPKHISMHDWWIGSCAMALGKVCYLREPTLLYRRHGENYSASTRRPWRAVACDRAGNLLALAVLLKRLTLSRRTR